MIYSAFLDAVFLHKSQDRTFGMAFETGDIVEVL